MRAHIFHLPQNCVSSILGPPRSSPHLSPPPKLCFHVFRAARRQLISFPSPKIVFPRFKGRQAAAHIFPLPQNCVSSFLGPPGVCSHFSPPPKLCTFNFGGGWEGVLRSMPDVYAFSYPELTFP